MKRLFALLLAFLLLVSVFVLPVLAAEPRVSILCPQCGNYTSPWNHVTIQTVEPVVTCPNYPASHEHTVTVTNIYAICSTCGYEWLYDKEVGTYCPYG